MIPPLLAAAALAVLVPQEPAPAPPAPVTLADWERRDLEGRWVTLLANRGDKNREEQWVAFLSTRREHDLLEWVSIYTDISGAREALHESEAPHWVRATVWDLRRPDSHWRGGAEKLLAGRPGLVLDWLRRHRDALTGPAAALREGLEAAPGKPEDASRLLPPLRAQDVLAHLEPPLEVAEFDDRLQAAPWTVYVHQIERAIAGLAYSGLHEEPWLGRLTRLLAHPHPTVRRAAALAWTSLPPERVPVGALVARVDSAGERPEVREAALLGLPGLRTRTSSCASGGSPATRSTRRGERW
ncbi:MAG: hypothetical protein L0216_13695 [Planctomycetales bacterium]|nr:hypothetical protein [Planctomycetales bacterium]